MSHSERGAKPGTGNLSGTLPSLLFGIPIGVSIWALVMFGPVSNPLLKRYLGHPVEFVEVVMFTTAITALVLKYCKILREKSALREVLLREWDGNPVHPGEAKTLCGELSEVPDWIKSTFVFRRLGSILDFVSKRNSSDGIDDQLRDNSDKDLIEFENSFALTRFITWAIPILGFLGTVLGITGAISGVTPEMLEKSMSTVTDGLALSFDATALALGLTMVTMFVSFLVEKLGESFYSSLDNFCEDNFLHRFLRVQSDHGPFMEIMSIQSREVMQTSKELVANQVSLWAEAMSRLQNQTSSQAVDIQEKMRQGVEQALSNTINFHQKVLEQQEGNSSSALKSVVEHMSNLATSIKDSGKSQLQEIQRLSEAMGKQTNMLWELQQGEKHLAHLQNVLQENLRLVNTTGNFQEAIHCLTAAVHMFTSKMQTKAPEPFSYNSAGGIDARSIPGKVA